MITFYGLKNCDTCRKALKWAKAEGHPHQFVDIRAEAPEADKIRQWVNTVGWEKLLNQRSTTWRGLSDEEKSNLNEGKAIALMAANPTLIKRPVSETSKGFFVGFKNPEDIDL